MHTRERIVIYTVLTALVAVNAMLLLGRSGTQVHADPGADPGADPVAAPVGAALDALGPAESLTLVGEGDTAPLVLRNRARHLSWSDAAHDRVYSVAYVYIGTVLKQLMNAEEFKEDREFMVAELNEEDEKFRRELEEIGARGQDLEPDSDEFRQVYEQYLAMREEYGKWQQEAMARRGRLDAKHLESAYRQLIDAVEVVADRKRIDTVYRFIPTSDPFDAESPEQAMQAIRLRSALRYPKELDITVDVLEELSLEVE